MDYKKLLQNLKDNKMWAELDYAREHLMPISETPDSGTVKRRSSSACSLESDIKSLWRSLSAPIGSGGGLYTEGYQKARAEMRLAIGQILITHKENDQSSASAEQ